MEYEQREDKVEEANHGENSDVEKHFQRLVYLIGYFFRRKYQDLSTHNESEDNL
jgi:hypothetical protein